MLLLRQIEFATFDLLIHQGSVVVDVQETLDQVRDEIAVYQASAVQSFSE